MYMDTLWLRNTEYLSISQKYRIMWLRYEYLWIINHAPLQKLLFIYSYIYMHTDWFVKHVDSIYMLKLCMYSNLDF